MPAQSKLNIFLNLIDYRNVHQLPYNNNAQTLAATIRNSSKRLTGKGLVKENIKREANRLQLHRTFRLRNRRITHRLRRLYNRLSIQHIINLATNNVWKRLTSDQRNQFINLANNANNIRFTNHLSTVDQIARLTTPQITNNPLEDDFFNGMVNLNDDISSSLESRILPAGCLGSSSSFSVSFS